MLQRARGEDDTVPPTQLGDVRVPLHADLQLSTCCRVLSCVVVYGGVVCVCVCVVAIVSEGGSVEVSDSGIECVYHVPWGDTWGDK
jgi:hypothetical protein